MRLFYSLAISVLALSIGAVHAGAFKNEPTGFRGIEWGAAYADHAQGLDLVRQDNDVLVYMRQSERNVSDRDNYKKIAYRFYKDRFSAGIIQTYAMKPKENCANHW